MTAAGNNELSGKRGGYPSKILIPAPPQEADQIRFFFQLPINGKAPLALVSLDVSHNLLGTGSAEPWAQRQIRRPAQNRHVSAVTVVAELGEMSRFARAKQLMGYGGIVASEDSSGERTQRGQITNPASAVRGDLNIF